MEENQEIVQQMKMNHLRQAVAIGANQAENGEFSRRSVQDITTDANLSESTSANLSEHSSA